MPLTKLWLEPELSYQTLFLDGTFSNRNPSTYGRLALHARYELYEHLSFFGGPACWPRVRYGEPQAR